MSLLPILLIFVLGAFGFGVMKGIFSSKGNYVYSKRIQLIFIGYIAILLICMGVAAVLPANKIIDNKVVHNQKLEKESIELYEAAAAGSLDKIDESFINKKWSLDYDKQQISVAISEFFSTQIFVERKKTNDGRIEAVFYKSRSTMNERDISDLIKPPRLELAGNTLAIMNSKKKKMEVSQFQNIFSVNQFTGETSFGRHSSFFEGQSVLYLQIPRDLEIVDYPEFNFEFIE